MPPPANGFVTRVIVGPALRAQPDGRLVALVREGYESAFDEIVRRYGHPLRRYAAAIVGASADDVTQDALSKAFLALRRDDREIELRPWLYRILRNTALNDLRDRPPRAAELSDALEGRRGVAEEVEQREEIDELLDRLQALPEPQRAAIVMRELEGLGHEEIASALGISGGAARQAIHRARTALRDGLGMAIPLPLLKLILEGGGPSTAEIAAGGAGAGVVLKAATATVLVAGTLGAGVALHDDPHSASKPVDRAFTGNATKGPGRLATTAGESARTARQGGADSGDAKGGEPPGREHGDRGGSSGSSGDVRSGGSMRSGSHDTSEGGSSGPRSGHGGKESGDGTSGGEKSGGSSGSGDGATGEGRDSGSGSGSSEGSGDGQGGGGGSSSGDGSGSNSGPDSGGEEGTLGAETDGSRDSGDGEGLSGQMETRTTTEEDR